MLSLLIFLIPQTSEIGSIKNKADERKQYSAGSSVQKPSEPEAEHSTANSQMNALVKTLQNTKTIVSHEDMLEVRHWNEHYSSQNWAGVVLNLFFQEMKISVNNRRKLPSINIVKSDGFRYTIFLLQILLSKS